SDPTNTVLTQLNLDRPVDIAFACYGRMRVNGSMPADPPITTAQPVDSCEQRSALPPTVPPGQEDIPAPSWYGFILQSAPGTLAVAQWPSKPSTAFAGNDIQVL